MHLVAAGSEVLGILVSSWCPHGPASSSSCSCPGPRANLLRTSIVHRFGLHHSPHALWEDCPRFKVGHVAVRWPTGPGGRSRFWMRRSILARRAMPVSAWAPPGWPRCCQSRSSVRIHPQCLTNHSVLPRRTGRGILEVAIHLRADLEIMRGTTVEKPLIGGPADIEGEAQS
jgi:hypothetical protein